MSREYFFIGYWRIIDSVGRTVDIDLDGINETEFQLTVTRNVVWKPVKETKNVPLFKCGTFDIYKESYEPYYSLRFGTYKGHIIECEIESMSDSGELILNDGWCTYVCEKIMNKCGEYSFENPFTLLPALQNGYFSDLTISASNRRKFQVHKCILKFGAPKLDWHVEPPPLSGYSEDVISTILHFLYTGCLPNEVSEETLRNIISEASKLPGLEYFISLCHFQKGSLAIKRQIISLVSDMIMCTTRMVEILSHSTRKVKYIPSDFEILYCGIKNSFQEGAVAIAKLLVICKIYSNEKTKLSQEEDLVILEHIQLQIPVVRNNLKKYIEILLATLSSIYIVHHYWRRLMSYLVPKVEVIVEIISRLLVKIKACSEAVATSAQRDIDLRAYKCRDVPLDSVLCRTTLVSILIFIHELTGMVMHFEEEKRYFKAINKLGKMRLIWLALEDFLSEVPILKKNYTELITFLEIQIIEEKMNFLLRVIAMKLNEAINKVVLQKSSALELIMEICALVERDSFVQCLVTLGLLDGHESTASSTNDVEIAEEEYEYSSYEKYTFHGMESACKSPPTYLSHLSVIANELLQSGELHDMVFEVIDSGESDIVVRFTGTSGDESKAREKSTPKRHVVKAHRVVVATRCDWFRQALFSGMKEDINRKIEVHNTTPYLFSLFLEFLYTGCLNTAVLPVDDIFNLLFLSDRYDFVRLKEFCEFNLKEHIDEENVFSLLGLADRFNANMLKNYCVDFIHKHPEVVYSEQFKELPDNLKREVKATGSSGDYRNVKFTSTKTLPISHFKLDTLEKTLSELCLNRDEDEVTNGDESISVLSPKMVTAMVQLQQIIGCEVPRAVLVPTILDAKYNVNRAAILYKLRN